LWLPLGAQKASGQGIFAPGAGPINLGMMGASNEAIRQTNDEEMLLNLVRLRYGEHPSFLPVTGLNAQFEVNAGSSFRSGAERGGTDNWGAGSFGYSDRPSEKITVTTRSILEVMYLLSKTVSVPEEHAAKGILAFTHNPDGTLFDWRMVTGDLFKVCVAKHKPRDAYISVKYRGYWYYIDDRDLSSKTTLNLFNELLWLQRVGASEGSPILTLPLGP
jgi:hypothetical protein